MLKAIIYAISKQLKKWEADYQDMLVWKAENERSPKVYKMYFSCGTEETLTKTAKTIREKGGIKTKKTK